MRNFVYYDGGEINIFDSDDEESYEWGLPHPSIIDDDLISKHMPKSQEYKDLQTLCQTKEKILSDFELIKQKLEQAQNLFPDQNWMIRKTEQLKLLNTKLTEEIERNKILNKITFSNEANEKAIKRLEKEILNLETKISSSLPEYAKKPDDK
ncbi:hypothetical protein TRFO_03646 [Tritrichomonas foetus]|uniref:Uncharacterized protein n=1 Tax=Tritrichomonas foetus TaxID=1144522 RepID=A0A1J4KN04_9EUKA|nr:hypothetical protein TRFO_03646 [Tritrichomonas foetus]|eukprot:OHT12611.1 hypothetical protein TRFO_03646 [Tritrichomonas foetus]